MSFSAPRMVGGSGAARPADDSIQQIVDQLQDEISNKSGRQFSILRAVSYRSQIVAGTNYFIKVDTGSPNDHVHLKVHKPLPGSESGDAPQLHDLLLNKSQDEEIGFF